MYVKGRKFECLWIDIPGILLLPPKFLAESVRMVCKRCSSDRQSEFTSEMNLHFPGYEGLTKPTVWLFQKVVICLNCGFAEFTVSQTDLPQLKDSEAA